MGIGELLNNEMMSIVLKQPIHLKWYQNLQNILQLLFIGLLREISKYFKLNNRSANEFSFRLFTCFQEVNGWFEHSLWFL